MDYYCKLLVTCCAGMCGGPTNDVPSCRASSDQSFPQYKCSDPKFSKLVCIDAKPCMDGLMAAPCNYIENYRPNDAAPACKNFFAQF